MKNNLDWRRIRLWLFLMSILTASLEVRAKVDLSANACIPVGKGWAQPREKVISVPSAASLSVYWPRRQHDP